MKSYPFPNNCISRSTFDVRRSTIPATTPCIIKDVAPFQALGFNPRALFILSSAFKRWLSNAPTGVSRRTSNVERRTRKSSAFTLIELLAVMAIMLLLAGISVGTINMIMRKAMESRARAEIKAMETALESYKADQGGYPPLDNNQFTSVGATNTIGTNWTGNPTLTNETTLSAYNNDGWLNSYFVYRALGPTNAGAIKKYYQFSPKSLTTVTNTQGVTPFAYVLVLDPWGNPYGYNPLTPVGNPNSFDLFSAGLNGNSTYPTNLLYKDVIANWQK